MNFGFKTYSKCLFLCLCASVVKYAFILDFKIDALKVLYEPMVEID